VHTTGGIQDSYKTSLFTPGPGAYNPKFSILETTTKCIIHTSDNPLSRFTFASDVDLFKSHKTPGPGAYYGKVRAYGSGFRTHGVAGRDRTHRKPLRIERVSAGAFSFKLPDIVSTPRR
jgi:hypothetical protein